MAKRIVILGAGESGTGAAILAKRKGFEVLVSDQSEIKECYKSMLDTEGIAWEEGKHTAELILNAGEIIKSPGIPETAPLIIESKKKQIPLISEIEFAGRYTQAKMICITGSNGKTTTTSLIYYIFKSAGINVGLAGNIGKSMALQVAEGKEYDYYILELSSFQLDNMYDFRANIAILLNITPDHLDRYNYCMQNYVDSKMRITQNQTADDSFIYWNDDPLVKAELKKHEILAKQYPFAVKKEPNTIAYVEDGKLVITGPMDFNMEQEELALNGTHNLFNSMAAGISADIAGIKKEDIRRALSNFEGIAHRLQYVTEVGGVKFINDSKATNVNSCFYALESMKTKVILLLGGTDKGNDYSELDELVKNKVRGLVFLGVDNNKLHTHFDGMVSQIEDTKSMEDAVKKAYAMAKPGDTVLLSPCCASFDLFKNMGDRGNQFIENIKKLKA